MAFVRRFQGGVLRGDLRRGVVTLLAGTTLAQAIVVASSPFLTRLYTPSEVGTYSVAISIVAILITISCLSYQFAIPLPDSDVEAANVLALCVALIVAMSVTAWVVAWLVGPLALTAAGVPALRPYVLLLPLAQLGGASVSALSYWAVRTRHFSAIAATSLTQAGTLAGVQIGLGLAGIGALGLLVGDVAGRFSGGGRLARSAWKTNSDAIRQVSRTGMAFAAGRYRRFAIYSTPSSLLNTVGLQAPLLLLVALYGTGTGGQFALADRLCGLPVTLLSTAVGRVFFAEAARVAREEPLALRGLFAQTTRSLAGAAVIPFVLLALLAPLLAGLVFGEDWTQAGVFVAILAPMYYVILVTNPTGSTLDVLERQDLQLVLGLLRLGIACGAILAAIALGLPPAGAVLVLSATGCVTYGLYGLGSWRAIIARHTSLSRAPEAAPDAGAPPSPAP